MPFVRLSALSLLLAVFSAIAQQNARQADSSLAALLPSTTDGWQVSGQDQWHSRENLYEYIDGGAEMFLSFGFESGISRTYRFEGQPEITVDLFRMRSAGDAFGVFAMSVERLDSTYGQGCVVSRGMISFWKDRYYVSILSVPQTPESEQAIARFASVIDRAIPGRGELPRLISALPPDSLVRESVRYFTHHAWQNTNVFISNENLLDIGDRTDAVAAKYILCGGPAHLLIVHYQDDASARRAERHFRSTYPGTKGGAQSTAHVRRSGALLMIVLGVHDGQCTRQLFDAIEIRHRQGTRQ